MNERFASDTAELYNKIAAAQGLSFEPERFSAAVATHDGLRDALTRLREVPLSFLEPVYEPASALTWIENGGTSA